MNRLLKKFTTVVSAAAVAIAWVNLGGLDLTAWAAGSDGMQTPLDVSQGNIVITDTGVTVTDSGGNITNYPADEDGYVISGTTNQYTVTVSGTQNITLAGVNIDVSATGDSAFWAPIPGIAAFKIADGNTGNVVITLADGTANTLKGGYCCAGLEKNGEYISADNGKLIIQGGVSGTGALTATGGSDGAGIGSSKNSPSSNITIKNCIVTAIGGSSGASIGGGCNGDASNIVISGGSVKAGAIGGGGGRPQILPKDEDGNELFPFTVENPGADTVQIDGNIYPFSNHTPADSTDTNLYLYLEGKIHNIKVGRNPEQKFIFDFHNKIFGTEEGTEYIISGGVNGVDYSYLKDGPLTIVKDTALEIKNNGTINDSLIVESSSGANITLNGVNVNGGYDWPFTIEDTSGDVVITLPDGVDNVLTTNCGAIAKYGSSKLTIQGGTLSTGSLTATSGDYHAGIFGSNIEITGGIINATGGRGGAGIGGRSGAGGTSDITISGGIVTAIGGNSSPGIGSTNNGSADNIKITGGIVTATAGGAGAAGIGGGTDCSASNIVITGGSVLATKGADYAEHSPAVIGSGVTGVKNNPWDYSYAYYIDGEELASTPDSERVYLLELDKADTSLTIDGNAYPINHGDDKVYAYLTEGEHTIVKDGVSSTNTYMKGADNKLVAVGSAFTVTATDPTKPLIYGTDYTYPADTGVLTILSDKAVTISGSTETDIIFVAKDVSANITLNGVSIDVSATSRKTAFEIERNSSGNVTVTLVGDNTLKSGEERAGLQKNGSVVIIGTLTIQGCANGTGTLTATGGDRGAGIGGGYMGAAKNITISGCTVTATGGDGGAGIGGGYMGAAKNITIDSAIITAKGASGIGSGRNGDGVDGIQIINSTVKATGIDGAGIGGSDDSYLSNLIISNSTVTASGTASGIGGGTGGSLYCGGDCTDVTIQDSVVVATGSGGAGIGTGNANEYGYRGNNGFSYCDNITITNSVVTAKGSEGAAGIGGGVMGKCENVEIYGSSVIAEGNGVPDIGWGKYYEDPNNPSEENTIYGRAVNATSSGNTVYPFTIANPTGAAVIIDDTEYAYANHSAADKTDTNLYAYLTGEAHTVTIGEVTTEYKFYDGIFLPVPKASDFIFTAPENLKYTGEAKTATVTSDKNGMGVITTKYYNAAGEEVTQGADFVPGTYTVEIEVAKGNKYAEATLSDDDWTFTITAGDLTASGTGVASGTYGDTLGELAINGLFVDSDGTAVAGNWEIKSSETQNADYVPSVGDTAKYTATFTPNVNPTYYNTLTAEVSLDIAKANAPTIADIPVSYNWAATGGKTVTVSGLPVGMGTVGTATIEIDDDNGIIKANSAVYGQGRLRFTLNGFNSEKKDISATIKVTLPSQNYKDIKFNVIVSITAKQDREAPALTDFTLSVDLQDDNTYTAAINTELTGVEYSFDGENWSGTNTTAVAHDKTVTGYIRYAETAEYNASAYVYKSETTGHGTLTHHTAKPATCTKDGNIEYWTCDSCDRYFSDESGTTQITQAQTVIEKTGHKWLKTFESDKDGHWHKCEVCEATTEKEAHTPGEPATLDHAQLCTVCGYEIAPKLGQVAAPTFSPNGGTFTGSQKVTITCATEGAKIYYTTDGSVPTTSSKLYEGAFTISATTTVKAIAVNDGMVDSEIATATFTKKSSGGGGGGGGVYRPTTPTEPNNPAIGGSAKSWSDIAADLAKLATGSEVTITLNGNTTVPVEVIKVIDDRQLKVTFVVDGVKSWKTDGAEITTPAAADLSIHTTSKLKTDNLRGISGLQFSTNNTNIPTDLSVAFKTAHAGKFANLYKVVDGKLTFVTCAKLGEDGKVILSDVVEKDDYVAMLCEFSDRLGDMDNDGVMNAKDAAAILKDIVEIEPGKNPLMADFNGDGKVNAKDAAVILKRIVGLA